MAPLVQVAKLEKKLTATPSDPNPLLPLLALARHESPEVVHKATWALYRVFGLLVSQNRVGGITGTDAAATVTSSSSSSAAADSAREVKAWVRDRLLEYVAILGGLLRDAEPALRKSGLQLLFALLPILSGSTPVHVPYFRILLRKILIPTDSLRGATSQGGEWEIDEDNQEGEDGALPADVAEAVVEEYWAKYDDIRLFFFREAAALVAAGELENTDNLLAQLTPLTNLPKQAEDINTFFLPSCSEAPESDDGGKRKKAKTKGKKKELDALPDWMETFESESEEEESSTGKRKRVTAMGTLAAVHSITAHTNAYTDAWEAVLFRLPLSEGWTRRILANLHGERGILSHWASSRRVRLADWLGNMVDGGGAHAMLAMNGLFVLMTTYNLDYPRFYERLYSLLTPDVLHARYRARFFRLLDTFLRSPMLSAALVASFIKRLARISLVAPPAGAILVIPFTYNLFKRHPGTMGMLHRLRDEMDSDPYDADEARPTHTHAIDSSVWELAALQQHYLASVGTMAKVFTEQFTKPEFGLEDFLDHGYGTLFATEAQRRSKNPPALSVQLELGGGDVPPFPRADAAGERDIVAELWAF